jgi:hypothetical protein
LVSLKGKEKKVGIRIKCVRLCKVVKEVIWKAGRKEEGREIERLVGR